MMNDSAVDTISHQRVQCIANLFTDSIITFTTVSFTCSCHDSCTI